MKFRFAMLNLILLTAGFSALAKRNPQHLVYLHPEATFNGAKVPEGIYDFTWESKGSEVRVTIWKDGKFIASAPGVWVKNGAKYTEDALLLRVNSDGSRSLIEIRLAGLAKTIVLVTPESQFQLGAK